VEEDDRVSLALLADEAADAPGFEITARVAVLLDDLLDCTLPGHRARLYRVYPGG
jgi:hypothetical protein